MACASTYSSLDLETFVVSWSTRWFTSALDRGKERVHARHNIVMSKEHAFAFIGHDTRRFLSLEDRTLDVEQLLLIL